MATAKRKRAANAQRPVDEVEDPPLTAAQRRALERQVKDIEDRARYLLVATLPGLSLYYLMHDDAWAFDDPTSATLFKRRAAAKAIQALLRPGVHVVPCEVDAGGKLVLRSIVGRTVGKTALAVQPSWRRKRKPTA